VYKEDWTQNSDPGRTSYTILTVRLSHRFPKYSNKNHKSRLTYEIKYDMYKIAQKMFKKLKLGLLKLLTVFKN